MNGNRAEVDAFELGEYPYSERMKRKDYEKTLEQLQIELLKVQHWTKESGQRFLLIFEGRDAAGKGGTIKRFTEHLNPRGARVVALAKPSDVEQTQWYFQRYVQHLPSGGEIVFFDRSWYNRAGVERVMGFCEPSDWRRFYHEAPQFEDMMVESGVRLTKFWLTVTQKEQLRRFEDRRHDPLKRWKLSPIDEASLDKWDAYSEAREEMFDHTDTVRAPWTVVKTDDKRRARIACVAHFLRDLDYPDKEAAAIPAADTLIVGSANNARRSL